jgi:hypothetical protein
MRLLHGIAYLKRFAFGGAIMNKDYQCAPPGSKVLLFSDQDPEQIHVVYEPAKGQRIHQQIFAPRETPVKGAKTLGVQMTVKEIKNLSVNKPRNWDDNAETAARNHGQGVSLTQIPNLKTQISKILQTPNAGFPIALPALLVPSMSPWDWRKNWNDWKPCAGRAR